MNIHSHKVCSKRKSCLLNDCKTKCRDVTTIGSGKVLCTSLFSCWELCVHVHIHAERKEKKETRDSGLNVGLQYNDRTQSVVKTSSWQAHNKGKQHSTSKQYILILNSLTKWKPNKRKQKTIITKTYIHSGRLYRLQKKSCHYIYSNFKSLNNSFCFSLSPCDCLTVKCFFKAEQIFFCLNSISNNSENHIRFPLHLSSETIFKK